MTGQSGSRTANLRRSTQLWLCAGLVVNRRRWSADTPKVRARFGGEDHELYASGVLRAAAVVAVSAFALVLPHTAPIRWWAAAGSAVLFVAAGVVAWVRHQWMGEGRQWPVVVKYAHVVLAHTGAGFAGVAVGGIEGNQRFLLLVILAVNSSSNQHSIAVFGWVMATVTVYWSAVLGGTPQDIAMTVTAMFGASAAAVASVVHIVLDNQRAQAVASDAMANLAATIARSDTFDALSEALPIASDVLGGPSLVVRRVASDGEVVLGEFARPAPKNRWWTGRVRDGAMFEEVLLSTHPGQSYVLGIGWPSTAARRAIPPRTVRIVSDLLGHLVERSQRMNSLQHRVMTDPLTTLGNRRLLDEWMLSRSDTATVAILDLDYFKNYNDTFGHLAGDAVLRRLGATLRAYLRKEDCAVRLGGEEFCVALNGADLATAERYIDRVREMFARDESQVTFSAGVAEVVGDEPIERTLERADRALYEAKRNGRDQTVRETR